MNQACHWSYWTIDAWPHSEQSNAPFYPHIRYTHITAVSLNQWETNMMHPMLYHCRTDYITTGYWLSQIFTVIYLTNWWFSSRVLRVSVVSARLLTLAPDVGPTSLVHPHPVSTAGRAEMKGTTTDVSFELLIIITGLKVSRITWRKGVGSKRKMKHDSWFIYCSHICIIYITTKEDFLMNTDQA